MIGWLRRNPVAAFLPLQAILCFWNLGLMSPWMDEVGSLQAVRLSLRPLIHLAGSDIHPPGYYLLLWAWQHLPLGLDWAVQARALSILFLLAAGVVADRVLGSRLTARARLCFLTLWTLSPCLLLYGRMCRSYSLQLLVAIIGTHYLMRFSEMRTWRLFFTLAAAISAALYVHYVPGLALLVTANWWLVRRGRLQDVVKLDAYLAVVYLPWIFTLSRSLQSWTARGEVYTLTGGSWFEVPVKLAYWAMSFAAGEAMPDWAVIATMLLVPVLAWLVFAGGRRNPAVFAIAVSLSVVGLIGVARWVSYPFIPARMLFVFPLFLFLLVAGINVHRRTGAVAMCVMLAISLTGIWCYFHKVDFRNKQYPMPMAEIAARISQTSTAADSAILVDSTNADAAALAYAMGPLRRVLRTAEPQTAAEISRSLSDSRVRTVWFLRNTHDVSAGHLNQRFEGLMERDMRPSIHGYQPFSPLETWAMQRLGMADAPKYFQELLEFRR